MEILSKTDRWPANLVRLDATRRRRVVGRSLLCLRGKARHDAGLVLKRDSEAQNNERKMRATGFTAHGVPAAFVQPAN